MMTDNEGLTEEQLRKKIMFLEMALGVIAVNDRVTLEDARKMAREAPASADEEARKPPPKDIFDALGLGDGDTILDARDGTVGEITVGAVREEVGS